jgi:hypothetical protein
MKRSNISVNLCTSVSSAVKKTVVREPQITRIKRMAQMSRNNISVELKVRKPKVRNLCTSVSSAVKEQLPEEPQITQMKRNSISVEPQVRKPKVRNLCTSVSSAVKEQLSWNRRLRR